MQIPMRMAFLPAGEIGISLAQIKIDERGRASKRIVVGPENVTLPTAGPLTVQLP